MNAHRPRSARTSRVLLTLAVLSLAMRLLLPTGFMMGQAPTGAYTIVICSPDGDRAQTIDLANGGAGKKPVQGEKHDAPCVFAGHGLADAPAEVLVPAPLRTVYVPAVASTLDVVPGRGLAAPPPPSTGPPVSLI